MPAYVYKCKVCEHTYEKKKRFSDPHDTDCPECGESIRRVINSVGIVFKGSGFYVNDSKSSKAATSSNGTEKSEKNAGEKKGDTADSPSSSDTTKESKPKAKESKKSESSTP